MMVTFRSAILIGIALTAVSAMFYIVAVLFSVPSAHAEGFEWKHFGADPYASSREEAMRTREEAFFSLGIPAQVVAQLMRVTEKPGEKVRLTVGDRLTTMMSKGGVVHRDVVVAFIKPPISGKMEYAAPAEKWQVTFDGKIYTVFLPEVCYNWSANIARLTTKEVRLACATVNFTVVPGDEVRFAILSRKRLHASACWQLCDGDDCAMFPSPCDTCDWVGPLSVIPTGFVPLHTGRYVARAERQALRLPLDVMGEYVALCDERAKLGQSNSAVIMPPTWGKDAVVTIPKKEFPLWGSEYIGRENVPAARK